MVKKKPVSTAMSWSTYKMRGPQLLENLNSGRSVHLDMSDKIMTRYPVFLLIISAIGNRKVSIFIWVCTRFTLSAVVWCKNLNFSSMSCVVWPLLVQVFPSPVWLDSSSGSRPPHFWTVRDTFLGRDCVVGIATRYGLDSPGIKSRWGARISAPVQTEPEALHSGCRVFTGGKAAEAWRWPPTPSSVKVKEWVELYFYSPSASSWPVLGRTLPLPSPGHTQTYHSR